MKKKSIFVVALAALMLIAFTARSVSRASRASRMAPISFIVAVFLLCHFILAIWMRFMMKSYEPMTLSIILLPEASYIALCIRSSRL